MASRKITGSEALVEALRLENVRFVFGMVGSAFMDPLDLFGKAGIRFVQVRHEQSAGLMAEGYARASGGVGVCIGQNGPGITNLVTGIASAFLNHAPVVVITPAVTSGAFGTNALQEIDQIRLLAPIVKWQTRVMRPDRISDSLRSAFRAALALRGPVQVDIPRDFYYGEWDDPGERPPSSYRLDDMRIAAGADAVEKAASLLAGARAPVIVVGQGGQDPRAAAPLRQLAETLGAPVATAWLHNDAFPGSHPLSVGPLGYQGSKAAMALIRDADVVLALGTRLNAFGVIPQYDTNYFPAEAKLIHNSIDALEIGATFPIACGLHGDCATVAAQLLAAVAEKGVDAERAARRAALAETHRAKWAAEFATLSADDRLPMQPRRAHAEIVAAMPKETVVVTDVGNAIGAGTCHYKFDVARRWFAGGSLGAIGVGFTSGLGVKLARPAEPVLSLIGDGAWSMTMQEVLTAAREDIRLVTVILDNSVYGAERRNQVDFFDNRYFSTDLRNPDFAAIATEMGAVGITCATPSELSAAVKEAFGAGKPVVIDAKLDPLALGEPYRRDAMRKPVRHLPFYAA